MIQLLDADLVGESSRPARKQDPSAPILVLGVGNLLMGDEGVGVHILRALELENPTPNVRLLDGGTGGANLLGEFEHVRSVVLIDATRDGDPAGTIGYRFRRHSMIANLPRGLSAHDFGLKDLFAAAALLGSGPELHLVTISVETVAPMCTCLSEPVSVAAVAAQKTVKSLVRSLAERL